MGKLCCDLLVSNLNLSIHLIAHYIFQKKFKDHTQLLHLFLAFQWHQVLPSKVIAYLVIHKLIFFSLSHLRVFAFHFFRFRICEFLCFNFFVFGEKNELAALRKMIISSFAGVCRTQIFHSIYILHVYNSKCLS